MRYALIDRNGNVVNVISLELGSNWTLPVGHSVIQNTDCQIGDTYDGVTFTRINMIPDPIIDAPLPPSRLDLLEARITELEKR